MTRVELSLIYDASWNRLESKSLEAVGIFPRIEGIVIFICSVPEVAVCVFVCGGECRQRTVTNWVIYRKCCYAFKSFKVYQQQKIPTESFSFRVSVFFSHTFHVLVVFFWYLFICQFVLWQHQQLCCKIVHAGGVKNVPRVWKQEPQCVVVIYPPPFFVLEVATETEDNVGTPANTRAVRAYTKWLHTHEWAPQPPPIQHIICRHENDGCYEAHSQIGRIERTVSVSHTRDVSCTWINLWIRGDLTESCILCRNVLLMLCGECRKGAVSWQA